MVQQHSSTNGTLMQPIEEIPDNSVNVVTRFYGAERFGRSISNSPQCWGRSWTGIRGDQVWGKSGAGMGFSLLCFLASKAELLLQHLSSLLPIFSLSNRSLSLQTMLDNCHTWGSVNYKQSTILLSKTLLVLWLLVLTSRSGVCSAL